MSPMVAAITVGVIVFLDIVAIFAIPALIWMLRSTPELHPQDEAGLSDNEAGEAAVVQSIHNRMDI